MKKRPADALLVRVQVSANSLKDHRQHLSKFKMHLPLETTIPLLDLSLLINSTYIQRHEHVNMEYWKLSKFPSRVDC